MSLINDVMREIDARQNGAKQPGKGAWIRPSMGRSFRQSLLQSGRRWSLGLIAALIVGGGLHWLVSDLRERPAEGMALQASLDGATPFAESTDSQPGAAGNAPEPEVETTAPATPALPASDPSAPPAHEASEVGPSDSAATEAIDEASMAASEAGDEIGDTAGDQTGDRAANQADDTLVTALDTATGGSNESREPGAQTGPAEAMEPRDEEDAHIAIERSGSEPQAGEDPIARARRTVGRGQPARARDQLRSHLDSHPEDSEARVLLARLLLDANRSDTAVRTLEAGLDGPESTPVAWLLGRVLSERGEIARARELLESHAPPSDREPEYHLLLAALDRRDGAHAAARDRYRAVTGIAPHRATAWVGLGASLEALDAPHEAREAYENALAGDDPRAIAFARSRLAALPGPDGDQP